MSKEQQSLYLSTFTIAALRGIADSRNVSVSQVADDFLQEQIKKHRAEDVILSRVRLLEQNLPASLAGVDRSHPIFGKKPPHKVIVKRRVFNN